MATSSSKIDLKINVVGNTDNVKVLVSAFEALSKASASAQSSIDGISQSLATIKSPPNLTKFIDGLKQLERTKFDFGKIGKQAEDAAKGLKALTSIKVPNILALSNGLERLILIDIKQFEQKITPVVSGLQKLTNIKSPPILSLANGLEKLVQTPFSSFAAKTTSVYVGLSKFKDISVSHITAVSTALTKLVNTSFSGFAAKITTIETGLTRLANVNISPMLTVTANALSRLTKIDGSKIIKLTDAVRKLQETSFSGFNTKITTVVTGLERLAAIKLRDNYTGLVNLSTGLTKLMKLDVDKLTTQIKQLNTAIDKLNKQGNLRAFSSFASDLRNMSSSLTKAYKSASSAQTAFSNLDTTLKSTGRSARTFADRIVIFSQFRILSEMFQNIRTAVYGAFTAITEYDQALKDLQAITGATSLEVEQMGEKILDVASKTKFSASEVAEGMRTLGQAGFTAAESIGTMQAVSDLATGTLSDMSNTVDLFTTVMRVYNIESSRSAEIADVFANAVNKSKLTVDKLRTSMQYVGPIAKESGVSFQELSSAMMVLANAGLRSSKIGTGLRRVFAELVSPSEKLKKAVYDTGVSLLDLDPQTNSLSKVLLNLNLVLQDSEVAFDIFGKRGAAAAIALTKNQGAFSDMMVEVQKSGTAADMAAIQMEGLGVAWKNAQDKFKNFAIALGKAGIADVLKLVVDAIRLVTDAFTTLLNNSFVRFTAKGAILIGSITAITVALMSFGSLLNGVVGTALTRVATSLFSFTAALDVTTASAYGSTVAFGGLGAAIDTTAASITGLKIALGVVGVALVAISAVIYTFVKSAQAAKDASEAATKLADTYEQLNRKMTAYSIKVATLATDTDEYKNANTDLREELLKTAANVQGIGVDALKAARSIDPVTGALYDNGEALALYSKRLRELQLVNISEAADKAEQALTQSVNKISRAWNVFIHGVKNAFKDDFVDSRRLDKSVEEFAYKISQGTVSLKEMQNTIDSWRGQTFTAQMDKIKAHVNATTLAAEKFIQSKLATGELSLDSTVKEIEKVGKASGKSQLLIDYMVDAIADLSAIANKKITNPLDSWEKQDKPFAVQIDEYNTLVTTVTDGAEKQTQVVSEEQKKRAKLYDNEIQDILVKYNILNAKYKEDTKNAGTNYELQQQLAYQFYTDKLALEKEAGVISKNLAHDSEMQKLKAIVQAGKEFENAKKEINAKINKDEISGAIKHGQEMARIEREYQDKLLKIRMDYVQPKDALSQAKLDIEKSKQVEQDKLDILLQSHVKGLLSIEAYESEKRKIEQDSANARLAIWTNYEEKLKAQDTKDDNKSYQTIQRNKVKADIEASKLRIKNKELEVQELQKLEQNYLTNLQTQYDQSVEVLTSTLGTKFDTLKNKLDQSLKGGLDSSLGVELRDGFINAITSMVDASSKPLSDLRERLEKALKVPDNAKSIKAIGDAFKATAKTGITAYQDMGKQINTVLDSILAKEKDLVNKIESLTSSIDDIYTTAAEKRSAIAQLSMSDTEKWAANEQAVRDKLKKSEELYQQALSATGKTKETLLQKSKEYSDQALQDTDKLTSAISDGISAEKEREQLIKSYAANQEKTTSDVEEYSKKMAELNTKIALGDKAKLTSLELIDKAENQSVKTTQLMLTEAEKSLKAWKDIEQEINNVKTHLDDIIGKLQGSLTIDFNADGALQKLDNVLTGLSIDVSTENVVEQIVKVGDTWTNVWGAGDKAATQSTDKVVAQLKNVHKEVKLIDGVWTNLWNDETTPIIKPKIKMSPPVPFSDGINNMKEKLQSLSKLKLSDIVIKLSSQVTDLDVITILKKQLDDLQALNDLIVTIILRYVNVSPLDDLLSKISKLKDKTITITTKYVAERAGGGFIDTPQQYADGGSVFKRLSSPFINRGSGTKDDVPAMLMRGEFVLKQSAVNKYGKKFLHMLNAGILPKIPGFKDGGLISNTMGGIQQSIREATLHVNPNIPFKHGDTVYNINAPSFHANLDRQTTNIKSSKGKSRASSMLSLFSDLIPKLRLGGGTSLLADFNTEKNLMIQMYNADIENAKTMGDDEVAFALEMEKIQLEELATTLMITLEQIRLDYEQEMLELTSDLDDYKAEMEEQKLDAEVSYQNALSDLISERASIERDYLAEKGDLERERDEKQRLWDSLVQWDKYYNTQSPNVSYSADSTYNTTKYELDRLNEKLTSLDIAYHKDIDGVDTDEQTIEFERDSTIESADKNITRKEDHTNSSLSILQRKETNEISREETAADFETQTIKAETSFNVNKIETQTSYDIKKLELELQLELLKLRQRYDELMRQERQIETQDSTVTPSQLGIKYWLNKGGWVGYPKGKKRKEDSVMAMLTPGEFVLNEDAVQHYGADFMEALNNREVDPNYSDFPSFLGNPTMVSMPTTIDGVTYHINAPSFHTNLANRTHKLQTKLGKTSAQHIVNVFSDAIPHLATGGALGDAEAQLAFELRNITAEYTERINDARVRGDKDLAYILEMEQIELQMIADELQYTLETLTMERDFAIQEAQLEHEDEVNEINFEFEETLLDIEQDRIDAKFDLETKLAEYERKIEEANAAKVQADLQNLANLSSKANSEQMIKDRINQLSGYNITTPSWVTSSPYINKYEWEALERERMVNENKEEILALEQELRDLQNGDIPQVDLTQYDNEIATYQNDIQASKDKYNQLMDMYAVREANAQDIKTQTTELADSIYDFELDKATREYDFGTTKAQQEADIDTTKLTTEAEKDYFDREQEMIHDIQMLEIELAKALFDLKKEYSTAGEFGITHFLNKGGAVGYPVGFSNGTDSIPAMLTPGEFVIKESVVRKFGKSFFDKLNNFRLPRIGFADGGLVPGGDMNQFTTVPEKFLGTVNLSVGGKSHEATMDFNVARNLVKEFKKMGMSIA